MALMICVSMMFLNEHGGLRSYLHRQVRKGSSHLAGGFATGISERWSCGAVRVDPTVAVTVLGLCSFCACSIHCAVLTIHRDQTTASATPVAAVQSTSPAVAY
jgi:hypothetical protein